MNKVFIIWNYDDGIVQVFNTKEKAERLVKRLHENGIYHEEDLMIKEELVYE